MLALIDTAAEALRREAPVFTRRNLSFAARRAGGTDVGEPAFEAALRRRLARGPLPGLLPDRARSKRRPPGRAADDRSPKAVLLVDRRAVLDLFEAMEETASAGLAVVCADGSPSPVVARLARSFEAGLRAPVLYLHDAATVVYPFLLEPLATLVRCAGDAPIVYRDLGLPPLGAPARRFGDPTLPDDEPILDLEAVPPAALVRYAARAAAHVAAG
jgi:hypothetical protein